MDPEFTQLGLPDSQLDGKQYAFQLKVLYMSQTKSIKDDGPVSLRKRLPQIISISGEFMPLQSRNVGI